MCTVNTMSHSGDTRTVCLVIGIVIGWKDRPVGDETSIVFRVPPLDGKEGTRKGVPERVEVWSEVLVGRRTPWTPFFSVGTPTPPSVRVQDLRGPKISGSTLFGRLTSRVCLY